MINTSEYYGGLYPDPPEIDESNELDDDYDLYMADIMYEKMMLGDD